MLWGWYEVEVGGLLEEYITPEREQKSARGSFRPLMGFGNPSWHFQHPASRFLDSHYHCETFGGSVVMTSDISITFHCEKTILGATRGEGRTRECDAPYGTFYLIFSIPTPPPP